MQGENDRTKPVADKMFENAENESSFPPFTFV